jgi:predicted DNA binding protein
MRAANELCVVSAALVHDDDWTVSLKDSDPNVLSISNVSSSILSARYDQEAVVVRASDKDACEGLLRNLKANPLIHSTEILYSAEFHRMNYQLISIIGKRDSSIFSLMASFRCIPISSDYSRGMEYWRFMCRRSDVREVAMNIREMTTVTSLELSDVSQFTLESAVKGETLLSPREFGSTLAAYRMGYFDYPRRADLTELAKQLHLSKGTVHEYLRKGVSN